VASIPLTDTSGSGARIVSLDEAPDSGLRGARAPVTDLITFLLSSRDAYLSGNQFTVDGGLLPTV
jgi:hypothetical protein